MANPVAPTTTNAAPVLRQGSESMPTAGPMIEVRGVTKRIGEKTLVENLSFDVGQGEIFGFIGPSGSGKTSTIRLLTGVYEPTEGEVRVMGVPPNHPSRLMQEHFGYMPQLFVLYPNLTVRENLNFVAGLYALNPFGRKKRIDELLRFVELWEARDRLASNVSGGMQRRMELAASLLHDTRLLFVDEPTAGIDPVLRAKFWEEFHRLKSEGRTIFVTTQYVGESEYCDRVAIIRKGRLIGLDTPTELRRNAFGGEIVDIEADGLNPAVMQALLQPDYVRDIRPVSRTRARLLVQEAGPTIPALMDLLRQNGCEVRRIEEYKPSFDEVFIEMMNRDAEMRGDDGDDAGAD